VANFISLVKKGFYDGLTFHRVLPNFMAQGGVRRDRLRRSGLPDRMRMRASRQPEALPRRAQHAHRGPDTGGSQFFLCFVPTIGLDGPPSRSHHTVFGRVVEGLDQLAKIRRRDPEAESPGDAEKIISMKVIRTGARVRAQDLPELK